MRSLGTDGGVVPVSGMDHDVVIEDVEDPGLEVVHQRGEVGFRTGLPGAAGEEGVPGEQVGARVGAQDECDAVRSVTPQADHLQPEVADHDLLAAEIREFWDSHSFNGKAVTGLKASRQSETRLRIVLKTPPRGLIEHLCAEAGLGLATLRRIRIGRLPLAGLEPGQWRYLAGYEKF